MFECNAEVTLNFQDVGSGEPVLLIHGVGSDLESWEGVLSYLSPSRRYILYDQRGHGRSSRTPGPYSLSDLTNDAVALLDHLDLDIVSVVGFSLGGLVAQSLAINHSTRVANLILISTVAGRTTEEKVRVNERAKMLTQEGALTHLTNAVDRWFTTDFIVNNPEVLKARREKTMQIDPDCYAAAYQVLASNDLGDQLNRITVPTLVMTGENDIGSNPRMSNFIHTQIKSSELNILPRLKHSVLLEAPELVGGLIEPFLTKHTAF